MTSPTGSSLAARFKSLVVTVWLGLAGVGVAAPQIQLYNGPTSASPALSDGQSTVVDYGYTPMGTPVSRNFAVVNAGTTDLHVSGVTLPGVYEVVGGFTPVTVAPGATFLLRARFLANTVDGLYAGSLVVANDDATHPTFTIPISARATVGGSMAALDLSFNGTGKLVMSAPSGSEEAKSAAPQSDGKIIVAVSSGMTLVRLNNDGTVDTTFGTNGRVSVAGGQGSNGLAVMVLPDDRIVVGGSGTASNSNSGFMLARFSKNGVLDTTFGTNGVVTSGWLSNTVYLHNAVLMSDGRIVAVGLGYAPSATYVITRYSAAGVLDTSFGSSGWVSTTTMDPTAINGGVAVQPDGKVLLAGAYYSGSSTGYDLGVLRFTSTGSVDTGFGTNGRATVDFKGIYDQAYGVALQPDGKIVVCGYGQETVNVVETRDSQVVARFTSSGILDSSFNGTGIASLARGSQTADRSLARSISVRYDGKIAMSGYFTNSNYYWTIAWFLSNGTLDTSGGGLQQVQLGGLGDKSDGMVFMPNGKALLYGGTGFNGSLIRFGRDLQPTVVTSAATSLGMNSATLNGTVAPNGVITSAWFDYGTGGTFTNSTPAQDQGFGTTALNLSAAISGLQPSVTYNVRLHAQTGSGSTFGSTVNFTTPQPRILVYAGVDTTAPQVLDTQASPVDYGVTALGTPISRSFTLKNNGGIDLHLSQLDAPAGYALVGSPFPTIIVPGATLTFQMTLLANTQHGVITGGVNLYTDDPDHPVFYFTLTGNVLHGGSVSGLDTSFNTTGIATTAIGTKDDYVRAGAVQADGKLVFAGTSNNGTNNDFAVVRYTAAGALDNFFGSLGKVTTAIGSGDDFGTGVVVQPDGKIVVGGYTFNGTNNDFAVARYSSGGLPDSSFGTGGKVTIPIGSGDDFCYAIALQADGKIVLGGYSSNGTDMDFALVRCTNTGALDTSFGTGGKVTIPVGTNNDYGQTLALQSDGKIILAGYTFSGGSDRVALVRCTTTGALDTSFGSGGKVTTAIGSSHDLGRAVAVQPDGKIVLGGTSYQGSNYDFALLRYDSAGVLDPTFGTNGKVTTAIGSSDDGAYGLALQPDGRILLAGSSNNGANNDFALVRYTTAGVVDTNFNGGGKVTTPIGTSDDVAYCVLVQPDGRVVLGGSMFKTGGYDIAVARYVTETQPVLLTQAATGVTHNTATIGGTANPLNVLTTAWLEWGTTTAYGNTSAEQNIGYGSTAVTLNTKALTGLIPGTVYHYRVAARNAETTAWSADATFTTPPLSSNANLSALSISAGALTPAFSASTLNYSATFAFTVSSLTVTPTVADAEATVAINGTANTSGAASASLPLIVGDNTFNIVVTASNGATRTYQIVVTRLALPQSRAQVYAGPNTNSPLVLDSQVAPIDFGFIAVGSPSLRTFTFKNTGVLSLHLSQMTFPANYSIQVTPFPATIAPGASLTIEVRLLSKTQQGVLSGDVALSTDDPDHPVFHFTVTGTVLQGGSISGLDTSFNTTGIQKITGNPSFSVSACALLTDGKLLFAGTSYNGTRKYFGVVRCTSAGSLDTTFGVGGKVITAIGTEDDFATGVVAQTDGKIVVGGYSYQGSHNVFAMARYTSAGNLDTSFGSNGKVSIPIGSGDSYCNCIALQADGKLVLGGQSHGSSKMDFALVRCTTSGALDGTFGTGGKVTIAMSSDDDSCQALAVQPDGKIVLAGYTTSGSSDSVALARCNTNGSLDTSFGIAGMVTTLGLAGGNAVAVQPDGKIVVGGYAYHDNYDFALFRYDSAGVLDPTFGTGGEIITPIGSGNDIAFGLALLPNGNILLAGYTTTDNGLNTDFALVRYTAAGALDSTFNGTGGIVTTSFGSNTFDIASCMAVQPDGHIVLGGRSYSTVYDDIAVARYVGGSQPLLFSQAATDITHYTATIGGATTPTTGLTAAWLEWGTTTAYGSSSPEQNLGSGTATVSLSAALTGLIPNTVYHYRMAGRNAQSTAYSADATFFTVPLSSNANLSSLAISTGALSPAFNSATLSYSVSVANSVSSLTLTPTKSDADASITINGIANSSGVASAAVPLNVGTNTVNTVVTAADGTLRTYQIVITRAATTFRFALGGDAFNEDTPFSVEVTRSGDASGAVSVTVQSVDNTAIAGTDFNAVNTIVNFAAGETTKSVDIIPIDSHGTTGLRYFQLVLVQPSSGTSVTSPSTFDAYLDKVGVISFEKTTFNADQGAIEAFVHLQRSGGTAPCKVWVSFTDGVAQSSVNPPLDVAVAGVDYNGTGQWVSIASGYSSRSFTVPLLPKTGTQPNRHFSATLSSPSNGGTLGLPTTTDIRIASNDTTNPTFSITTPAVGAKILSVDTLHIAGVAQDKHGIDRVDISLNGSPFTANLSTGSNTATAGASVTFSIDLPCPEGANTLIVRAYDLQGNMLQSAPRSFTFNKAALLEVTRTVPAAVAAKPDTVGTLSAVGATLPATINLNPQQVLVKLGSNITLKPTAKVGYLFQSWSSSSMDPFTVNPSTGELTVTVNHEFKIDSHWIANPYGPLAGSHVGLVVAKQGTTPSNATDGLLTVTLTSTGSFTGSLVFDGGVHAITGFFDANGHSFFGTTRTATQIIDRHTLGKTNLVLDMDYDVGNPQTPITGTISEAAPGTRVSTLSASKALHSAALPVPPALLTTSISGAYSVALQHRDQSPVLTTNTYPQGDGYATASLSKTGTLTMSGILADGTAFSASTFLVNGEQAPVFAQLVTPGAAATVKGGSIRGMLTFDNQPTDTDVTGSGLVWYRPSVTATTNIATQLFKISSDAVMAERV